MVWDWMYGVRGFALISGKKTPMKQLGLDKRRVCCGMMCLISNEGFPPLTEREVPFFFKGRLYMDVSKNRGTPKWMVYNGNPY